MVYHRHLEILRKPVSALHSARLLLQVSRKGIASIGSICKSMSAHPRLLLTYRYQTICVLASLATTLRALVPCRRKKDHGRAEALLIVAWALGVRAPKISTTFAHVAEGEAIALPADAEGELVVTEGRVPISSSYELEVTEPFSEGLAVT